MRRILACAVLLACPALGLADGIPRDVLQQIKEATVFVKVEAGPYRATGSGFLMQTTGDSALLVTNEHVCSVPKNVERRWKPRIEVVFDSGRKTERVIKAEVVAKDNDRDLAILRISKVKDIPKSLDCTTKTEPYETMGVYVFGFPFGKLLSQGKGNPAITVGKGSVSSLREDDRGDLARIQIDGDLNPGNSGGPVVDSKGRLIGVAVAKVDRSRIGFAIPPAHLHRMLDGRVQAIGYKLLSQSGEKAEVEVTLAFIDPLDKIKSAKIKYAEGSPTTLRTPRNKDGSFQEMLRGKVVELKVANQKARIRIGFDNPDKLDRVAFSFQPIVVNGSGKTAYLQPSPYTVVFRKSATNPNTTVGGDDPKPTQIDKATFTPIDLPGRRGRPCMCWSKDAKSFYLLDGNGQVHRISTESKKTEATRATGAKRGWLSLSAEGLLVSNPDKGELFRLHPDTLAVQAKIPVDNISRAVSLPGLSIAVADTRSGDGLTVIDLKKGKPVKSYDKLDFRVGYLSAPLFSPNGKYLFALDSRSTFARFRVDGTSLSLEQISPRIISGRFESIQVSGDGKYVCAPSGGGNRGFDIHQTKGPYKTFLFQVTDLKNPVALLDQGAYPVSVGFDTKSRRMLAPNSESVSIFDMKGRKLSTLRLPRRGSEQLLLHPNGREFVLLGYLQITYVELPQSASR